MKKFISLIIIAILFVNCNNGCDDIDCFTPPPTFLIEILDKQTGENLFTNGTYEESQINIKDLATGNNISFQFISENDYNKIQINTIGWETETVTYIFNIADDVTFNLFVDAERKDGSCCDYTEIKELRIDNIDHEITDELIKILI